MWRVIISGMRAQKRKYISIAVAILFVVIFIVAIPAIYNSYCEIQIDNAYNYSGNWDYKLFGEKISEDLTGNKLQELGYVETTYSAILGDVNKDDNIIITPEIDNKTEILQIIGIDNNSIDYYTNKIIEGRLPENSHELVVPDTFNYNGVNQEVGDKVELGLYILCDNSDNPLQINDYNAEGKFEYKKTVVYDIVGKYQVNDYSNINYIYNAFSGLDNAPYRTYFYKYNDKNYDSFENIANLLIKRHGLNVEVNRFVDGTLYTIYKTDFMRSINKGVNIVGWIIITVGMIVVIINVMQLIFSEERNIKLYHTIGMEKYKIFGLYLISFSMVYIAGTLAGMIALAAIIKIVQKNINIRNPYNMIKSAIENNTSLWGIVFLFAVATFIILFFIFRCINYEKSVRVKRKKQKSVIKNYMSWGRFNLYNHLGTYLAELVAICLLILSCSVCIPFYKNILKKSEINSKYNTVLGEYHVECGKNNISEEIRRLPGVKKVDVLKYTFAHAIIERNGMDYGPFSFIGVDKKTYEQLKEYNSDMMSYNEFVSNNYCYVFDRYIDADGKKGRDTDIEQEDKAHIYEKYGNGECDFVVAGVLDKWFEDFIDMDAYTNVIVPFSVIANFTEECGIGCAVYTEDNRISEVGVLLKTLCDNTDTILQDNSEFNEMQEDNKNVQYVVITVIFLLIITMVICIYAVSSKISIYSRRKEYEKLWKLGMNSGELKYLRISEKLQLLLDAVLISAISLKLMHLSILDKIYEYYDIPFKYSVMIMGITIAIIAVSIVVMPRRDYKRR